PHTICISPSKGWYCPITDPDQQSGRFVRSEATSVAYRNGHEVNPHPRMYGTPPCGSWTRNIRTPRHKSNEKGQHCKRHRNTVSTMAARGDASAAMEQRGGRFGRLLPRRLGGAGAIAAATVRSVGWTSDAFPARQTPHYRRRHGRPISPR